MLVINLAFFHGLFWSIESHHLKFDSDTFFVAFQAIQTFAIYSNTMVKPVAPQDVSVDPFVALLAVWVLTSETKEIYGNIRKKIAQWSYFYAVG